jgi:hypothetical protein
MGACITRQRHEHEYQQQRIIESTVKPETINEESNTRRNTQEYNKLLMEHLEKNKESLDVIAKSLTVLSNLNTPKSIRSCNSIVNSNNNNKEQQILKECNNCKCKTKLKNLKSPCSKVRSINLVKRINKHKHKRYLIEISDSYDFFENNKNLTDDDDNNISNSSSSSVSTTTSNNNKNEKLHIKLTKLKVNK